MWLGCVRIKNGLYFRSAHSEIGVSGKAAFQSVRTWSVVTVQYTQSIKQPAVPDGTAWEGPGAALTDLRVPSPGTAQDVPVTRSCLPHSPLPPKFLHKLWKTAVLGMSYGKYTFDLKTNVWAWECMFAPGLK